MKLHLITVVAVPLCSALAIQEVLGDLKNIESELFKGRVQNPLDDALELSPTFTPAEVIDTNNLKYTYPNTNDINAWTKNLFDQPFDEITNVPSDTIKLDLKSATNSLHPRTSDKTIYQLISESRYTTILAKIIDEDSELVDYLNSTDHNFTFFAPTDYAFRKIPCHRHHDDDDDDDKGDDGDDGDHRIPKEVVRALLRYHSSPDVLSAVQLFHSHTIPSALEDPLLGTPKSLEDDNNEEGFPQRLTVRAGFKGLTLNFYSHLVAANIGASNGLIHGIDSILLPPPPTLLLLDILPTKFSTFNLALYKTSLTHHLNTTTLTTSKGFTLFIPSNSAFAHLGLRINAFLFSPPGRRYLRALLKYHIVPNTTLYSDVLYTSNGEIKPFGIRGEGGFTHLDLPTLLTGREIAVDVAHLGPYVSFKVNGYQRVAFADALAKDGNIHVLDHVLIPPRRLQGAGGPPGGGSKEEEVELEDLMERLMPWVEENDDHDDEENGSAAAVEDEIAARAAEL
ncbi:Fasciclin domain-containing protein [Aspergillus cavernicola]|uniref:Fasciclin domain-containing protein n=1 Tax=Aspergillus cavernicola TaxID=176166 RepID=A0ABR4I6N5_9EURO